jgi:hypothetical protein
MAGPGKTLGSPWLVCHPLPYAYGRPHKLNVVYPCEGKSSSSLRFFEIKNGSCCRRSFSAKLTELKAETGAWAYGKGWPNWLWTP